MTEPKRQGITKRLYALGAVVAGLAAMGSLYTTGICACATVAQNVLMYAADKTDAESLNRQQKAAEIAFRLGMPEADVIKHIGIERYAKYCLQARGGAALVCMLPHNANFWRDTHVQLAFAFDAEHRVKSVRAEPIVRYTWF